MPTDKQRADILIAAIDYALDHAQDGIEWLRAWNEGDKQAMKELEFHQSSS